MEEPLVDDPLHAHFNAVVKGMFEGRVVPLLGAGVNLCGRPEDFTWQHGDQSYVRSGDELAGFLAEYFEFPASDGDGQGRRDLAQVSQYAAVIQGSGPLYEEQRPAATFDRPSEADEP